MKKTVVTQKPSGEFSACDMPKKRADSKELSGPELSVWSADTSAMLL
jgi:hypothetical protein